MNLGNAYGVNGKPPSIEKICERDAGIGALAGARNRIQQRTIFSRCSVTPRVAFRVSITSRAWRTMKA